MDAFSEAEEAVLLRMIGVNLLAVWRINKTFLHLLNSGGRIIITTSELDGQKALPFNGLYALTKTALGSYTDSLRTELALLGIRVIKVRPGAFATDLVDSSFRSMEKMRGKTKLFTRFVPRFEGLMRRFGGKANHPAVLTKKLFKIAEKKHPRSCYTVRPGFLLGLYNAVPYSLGTFAIKKLLNSRTAQDDFTQNA